jgi:hypothetical protein
MAQVPPHGAVHGRGGRFVAPVLMPEKPTNARNIARGIARSALPQTRVSDYFGVSHEAAFSQAAGAHG